jgi:2-amino-4-hydroxy-6-hydroxymethyldihydropteridine diphosphokinase
VSTNQSRNDNAFIGLGSNLGDRAGNLLLAVRAMMEAELDIVRLSSVYETEPVETFVQPDFLNLIVELRGDKLPAAIQLMETLLEIEETLGRTREVRRGPRAIDLDFLIQGDRVVSTPGLILPHPRLHQRRFVLEPLAELCPLLVHPTLKKTIDQLLAATTDNSEVRVWSPRQLTIPVKEF